MQIDTVKEFKTALRSGPYAWPGGHPLYFICDDGGILCCACARKEVRNIFNSIAARNWCDGWRVVGQDVNWEDPHLACDHCGELIQSAYGED